MRACLLSGRRTFCTPSAIRSPPDLRKPLKEIGYQAIHIDIDAPLPQPKISTLENGLRVVSLDWHSQGAGVGLSISTGSRYEVEGETGAAMYCEKMGFKSGKNFPLSEKLLQCESRGVNITSQQTREQILFEVEGLREDLPVVLELLTDSVVHPTFDDGEFEEQRELIQHIVSNNLDNPELWPQEVSLLMRRSSCTLSPWRRCAILLHMAQEHR